MKDFFFYRDGEFKFTLDVLTKQVIAFAKENGMPKSINIPPEEFTEFLYFTGYTQKPVFLGIPVVIDFGIKNTKPKKHER